MSDRFRRLDTMIAHEADEGVRELLLELRRKWEVENQEIDADFNQGATMQARIESLESALTASRLRECSWATGPGHEECDMVAGLGADLAEARAEVAELKKDLACNARVLARQCDLARGAEIEASRLQERVKAYAEWTCKRCTGYSSCGTWSPICRECPIYVHLEVPR